MADQNTLASTSALLDVISRSSGMGGLSTSYADLLSGYDHRGMGSAVPIHTEGNGLVFFTRPNLNLSYDNLSQDRMLTPLLTQNAYTYQRALRVMLDPVLGNLNLPEGTLAKNLASPLFNVKQAFLPLLTNTITSLNGWPDISLDTFTSPEGRLREVWSLGDGTSKNYQAIQLNATFRNIGGDPITLLFAIWATYIDHVHQDVMTPYLENIMENRIDYGTRIFRFTMDPSRTRIQKYASCMGAFPIGVPIGAAMNFSRDVPYSHENQQEVAIGFQGSGAEYMDPIILQEFNDLVTMFNPEMADDYRPSIFTKVSYQYLKNFNKASSAFPWVNMQTCELEWYVDTGTYEAAVADYLSLAEQAAQSTRQLTSNAKQNAGSLPQTVAGTASPAQGDSIFPAAGYSQALTDLANDMVVPDAVNSNSINTTGNPPAA
jgi:hypothetical protein